MWAVFFAKVVLLFENHPLLIIISSPFCCTLRFLGGEERIIKRNNEIYGPTFLLFCYLLMNPKTAFPVFLVHVRDSHSNRQGLQFDMVFIDGDKRTYVETYEMAMQQLNSGGFIVADNTLWDGHVVDHQYDNDHQTQGIERFNDHVAADPRVEQVILPMRDGLTLIRKIPLGE